MAPPLRLMLPADLGSVRVTQMVLVLKASRGHREKLRTGIVWSVCVPEDGLGEASGEGTVSAAVKGPVLRGF